MKLWSDSFQDGGSIPVRCAFGKHEPAAHIELSDNRNPHLAWSDLPKGTKSLALICHDGDVPSVPDQVNQEGVSVPASLPRVDFYHWVMVDIPPDASPIQEGEFSEGVTPRGKGRSSPRGTRHGINDYTRWFEGNADMGGEYFGYDGPCPPWNDELVHRYHFTLYALDVERCAVEGNFTAPEVLSSLAGHVLDQASIVGTYAINPKARMRGQA